MDFIFSESLDYVEDIFLCKAGVKQPTPADGSWLLVVLRGREEGGADHQYGLTCSGGREGGAVGSVGDSEGGVEGGGRVGTAHHLPHLLQAGQGKLRVNLFYVDL